MQEELSINVDNKLQPFEDYNFLRTEGIKLIEKLSGRVWTDYNSHDPGITLLEALCYTLTDLGYRTSFDIKDILTPNTEEPDWANIFYTSRQILPSNPVTLIDYRKLIIDTDGVKNAWIDVSHDYEVMLYLNADEKAAGAENQSFSLGYNSMADNEALRIKGLYKITVDYEEDVLADDKQQMVIANIRKKLNVHRNLCEDFLSITPVTHEYFTMEAEVQVREGFDIERINAKIFQVIHNFFSPSIQFYTLEQMMEKGYTAEEIFEGPSLKNGFIDTDELERSERYMDIHLSDIINLISDIPGVIAVKKCVFPIETQSAFSDFTQWITIVKEKERAPKLDWENSTVTFVRSGDRHRTDKEKLPNKKIVKDIYNFLQSEIRSSKIKGAVNDVPVPVGEFMNIADYYPFQYSLPPSYGMQEKIVEQDIDGSVIERAVRELKVKAKDSNYRVSSSTEILDSIAWENFEKSLTSVKSADQLNQIRQHYISFQINAQKTRGKQVLQLRGFLMFFEQVMADYLSQLASIGRLFSFDPSIGQTYYPQGLEGIYDMNLLIINLKKYHEKRLELIEPHKDFLKKRNAILDHLMARFGENPQAYAPPVSNLNENRQAADIKNKVAILSDYVSISGYRGSGFDFSNPDKVWDTDNVAGMKARICRLLGIPSYNTTFITRDWIATEKVEHPNKLTRTKVIIKDPDNPDNILLESIEYEREPELLATLQYILQYGFDETLYDIDARSDKYSYELRRRNQENVPEPIASQKFKSNDELVKDFKKLIQTLSTFANIENFHVLEHILLRPKMNPLATGQREHTAGGVRLDVTDLLNITSVPPKDSFIARKRQVTSYHFKTTTIKDPASVNKPILKLSLKKDRMDIIVADDDFIFESHVRRRMEHIRQVATDTTNFERITDPQRDNRSFFSIVNKSKKPAQVLARGASGYEKVEVMEEQIRSLIKFFSFELGAIDPQESDEVDFTSFADPYSFRISLFIPTWPLKFSDPGFRHVFEKAIYLETPSHIYPDVFWLDYQEMKDFEVVYKMWLQEISKNVIPDTAIVNNLINVVNGLRKRITHA